MPGAYGLSQTCQLPRSSMTAPAHCTTTRTTSHPAPQFCSDPDLAFSSKSTRFFLCLSESGGRYLCVARSSAGKTVLFCTERRDRRVFAIQFCLFPFSVGNDRGAREASESYELSCCLRGRLHRGPEDGRQVRVFDGFEQQVGLRSCATTCAFRPALGRLTSNV